MYPDQSLYPATSVPHVVQAHQPGAAARGPDPHGRGQERDRLVRARSSPTPRPGFGGPLNAFELMKGMIEAGRRGRPLRGPARLREEVRAHGRQGPDPDVGVHPHADRRAPGGRRLRRADADRRAHRRQQRAAPHERRGRARPSVPDGRAHARGLLPDPRAASTPRSRAALAYAPYADLLWCETSEPNLFEAKRFADADPRALPGQAARVQLLAVVQLGEEARRGHDRAVPEGARARWATSSSSSRWRASTR